MMEKQSTSDNKDEKNESVQEKYSERVVHPPDTATHWHFVVEPLTVNVPQPSDFVQDA
jgi:hypothetical protein